MVWYSSTPKMVEISGRTFSSACRVTNPLCMAILGGFHNLKRGVSHTYAIGLSHTCTIGLTHTPFAFSRSEKDGH